MRIEKFLATVLITAGIFIFQIAQGSLQKISVSSVYF